jgi:hypothetical protein
VPVTDVQQAVLEVLAEVGEPVHWTVIQDRALRSGAIDPFATPDVRGAVLGALRALVAAGRVSKPAKGIYGLAQGR